MLTKSELRKIADARLTDAEILFDAKRYDGALYLCGYAMELYLKYRICKTLAWSEFPSSSKEFNKLGLSSFRTHDLDILLKLSGVEKKVKSKYLAEWSAVAKWNPEARYQPTGTAKKEDAKMMIESTKALRKNL